MKRREFLRRSAFAAVGLAVAKVSFASDQTLQSGVLTPETLDLTGGKRYRWVHFHQPCLKGDLVFTQNRRHPIGMATRNAERGTYGWIQVYGPATIKISA